MSNQEHTVLFMKVFLKDHQSLPRDIYVYIFLMTFLLLLYAASVAFQRDVDVPSCSPTSPFSPAFNFIHLNGIHFFLFSVELLL